MAHFKESLTLSNNYDDIETTLFTLNMYTRVIGPKDALLAVRLLSLIAKLAEEDLTTRQNAEDQLSDLQASLAKEDFEKASQEGDALTLEQALASILA